MIQARNPTLLNVTYHRPKNGEGECFEVIYKNEDGNVYRAIEPAEADFYIVKPQFRDFNFVKPEERMERMDKVRCKISKIRDRIAKEMGTQGKAIMEKSREPGNFGYRDEVFRWPYSFGADFQPEYYYMKDWYKKYQLGTPKLTRAYMDIETDGIDVMMDLDNIPNTAHSPVNLITIILDDTNEAWTFLLRPYKPSPLGKSPQEYKERYGLYEKQLAAHEELMSNKSRYIEKLHHEFDKTYGYINYHFRDFENEIDLITDAFRLINSRKPNFCLFWNMRFDIQYLYHRIIALGRKPEDIMCHSDFPDKKCYFKLDRSTYLLEKQYDYFYCSSYTQYICQMRLYASIRKSQHKLRSVALNAISDIELKDRKVDYEEYGNINRFAYEDWIKFFIYNIKDVLLQKGIENKCKDVLTYYTRSHSNLTPYNKIFKETHLLRNVREMYFEKDGWVQSNNVNILNARQSEDAVRLASKFYNVSDDDDEIENNAGSSFKGAINAEPSMNDNIGMVIMGRRTNNVFANSMDYDMGAFYPSIKIASNMDPITLLFKAVFADNNQEFISGEHPNRSLNQQYEERDKNNKVRKLDFTGEAVNTYASGNILTLCYNYHGVRSVTDMYEEVLRLSAA